eukprot:1489323-Pleurochrysis_carterae.AAC.2
MHSKCARDVCLAVDRTRQKRKRCMRAACEQHTRGVRGTKEVSKEVRKEVRSRDEGGTCGAHTLQGAARGPRAQACVASCLRHGQARVVRMLMHARASIGAADLRGSTALHLAAQ